MNNNMDLRIRTVLREQAESIQESDLVSQLGLPSSADSPRRGVLALSVAAAGVLLVGGLIMASGRAGDLAPASGLPAGRFESTARYAPATLPNGWTVTNAEDRPQSGSGTLTSMQQWWVGKVNASGDAAMVISVETSLISDVDMPAGQKLMPNITVVVDGPLPRSSTGWTDGEFFHSLKAEGADATLVEAFIERLAADPKRPGFLSLQEPSVDSNPTVDLLDDLVQQDDWYATAPVFAWGSTITLGTGTEPAMAQLSTSPRNHRNVETYTARGTRLKSGTRVSITTMPNGTTTLSWTNGTAVFTLSGDAPVEQLTAVASSVIQVDEASWTSLQQSAAERYLAQAGPPDVGGTVDSTAVSAFIGNNNTTMCTSQADGTKRCSTFSRKSDLRAAVVLEAGTATVYGLAEPASTTLTIQGHQIDTTTVEDRQIYTFALPTSPNTLDLCQPSACMSIFGWG